MIEIKQVFLWTKCGEILGRFIKQKSSHISPHFFVSISRIAIKRIGEWHCRYLCVWIN
ncbi:hypothetical protein HMPREF9065_00128 [Aggregatibacter sp. oral taxon 458 str. W10330]|nr:hypothetical protein HMPREF9065_00128 [Aggregatibacter sp. oral taxon 458 str. W10330]